MAGHRAPRGVVDARRSPGVLAWAVAVVVLAASLGLQPVSAAPTAPAQALPVDEATDPVAPDPEAGGVNDPGAPVAPVDVVLVQPDGAGVAAQPVGDGARSWYVTPEGLPLAQTADGTWTYAEGLDGAGQLAPGAVRPDQADPPPDADPELAPTTDQVTVEEIDPGVDEDEDPSAAPGIVHQGNAPTLVLLAGFTDHPGTTTPGSWRSKWFGATASVADFYEQASYGELLLTPATESHAVGSGSGVNDGVVGWLPLGYAHPDPRNLAFNTARQIVRDAIVAADPFVNYGAYDVDGDKVIEPQELHISVIMAGYESAVGGTAGACGSAVWGHRTQTGTFTPTVDGVRAGGAGYTTFGELHCAKGSEPGNAGTIGIIAHEFGHDLGWPDLYDTDVSSRGVGLWSIMGYGAWTTTSGQPGGSSPSLPDPFLKAMQGWLVPEQVLLPTPDVNLNPSATHPDVAQLLDNPNGVDWGHNLSPGTGEYFLVENRQKVGYDAGLPGCGLLVWHIDESVAATKPNDDEDHKLVDLEEADGLAELDALTNDLGDGGDPFPGLTNKSVFRVDSNPNSRRYDGTDSTVEIAVTASGCTPQVTFEVEVPPALCPPDDPIEPNNSLGAAAPLTLGVPLQARACENNEDWWSVPVKAGRQLTVDAAFSHDVGNLDLSVHDGSGAVLASSTSLDDDERVQHTPTADGTVFVRVRGVSGDQAPYELTAALSWCPPDDPMEPNDSLATPTALTTGVEVDGVVCPGNVDTFAIAGSQWRPIRFDLQYVHTPLSPGGAGRDLDLALFGPVAVDGSAPAVTVASTADDDELLVFAPPADGTYLVQVVGVDRATNEYQLTATSADCPPDDPSEPNDDQVTATRLSDGVKAVGVRCPGDDDWHSIGLSNGEDLDVVLELGPGGDPLTMEIRNPSGAPVAAGTTLAGRLDLGVTATTPGRWAVRVLGSAPGSESAYRLTADASDCPADDAFEPNDLPASATPLTDAVGVDGVVCPEDVDVFSISASAGDTLDVGLDFVHSVGDLELRLLSPAGAELDLSATKTNRESIEAVAATTGTYLVEVTGYEGARGRYRLLVDRVPPPTAPGAPTVTTLTPGKLSVRGTWVPPVGDGGSPVLSYDLEPVVAGVPQTANRITGTTSLAVNLGGPGCVDVSMRVRARNAVGVGPWSAIPASVRPWVRDSFGDVGPSHPFAEEISWMGTECISNGYSDGTYHPGESVSRQAMAAFLHRLAGDVPPSSLTPAFADVPATHPFFDDIQWMAEEGISTGTPQPGGKPLFEPGVDVSRQAMAAFLHRYAGDVPPAPGPGSFADVPGTHPFFDDIEWMAEEGISTGTPQPGGLPLYKPTSVVDRQAMAAFLFRLEHPS